MRTKWLIFSFILGACAPADVCHVDTDCKGSRVCDAQSGQCMEPGQAVGDGFKKYATNALVLPSSMQTYARDIDGDGRTDNQFRAFVGALASGNIDLAQVVDAAVASGQAVQLFALSPADPATNLARLSTVPASPSVKLPRYDGSDSFTATTSPQTMTAEVKNGQLVSVLGTSPPTMALRLPVNFFGAAGVLPITLYGVRISSTAIDDSKIGKSEITGVIRKVDIERQIVPALAKIATDQINHNPRTAATAKVIEFFEDQTGNPASKTKCARPIDCCALSPTTCKITAEEVSNNALIGNVLAADIQVFRGDAWAPVPKGADKDAMSFGIGFTAVRATF